MLCQQVRFLRGAIEHLMEMSQQWQQSGDRTDAEQETQELSEQVRKYSAVNIQTTFILFNDLPMCL